MTRSQEDPRLTAYALDELDAEEQRELEETLVHDALARGELEEISRVAVLMKRKLIEPTGLRLSADQRLLLEGAWHARSVSTGEAGAPGAALGPFDGPSAGPALLEDFARPPSHRSARKRFAKALLAAALLHATAAAALVVFPSTAREFVEEQLEAVAFSPRPSPEGPPLAEHREALPRFKAKPARSALPVEVSDDKPAASGRTSTREAAMSDVVSAEQDALGTTDQGEPHPAPAPVPVTPPVVLDGSDVPPEYSIAAQRKGIEGKVVVTFDVLEDGTVANVGAVSGPPELFESVISAIGSWRFRPAHRGGQPVRYSMTRAVTFRLEAL